MKLLRFGKIYKEIISKLVSIVKSEKDENSVHEGQAPPAEDKDAVKFNKDEEVAIIQKRLDEYFVGDLSGKRQKLLDISINKFNGTAKCADSEIGLFFISCVLDESFSYLDLIGNTKPNFVNFNSLQRHQRLSIDSLKLLEVICRRSPSIETLKLSYNIPYEPEVLDATFSQLMNLKSLTSLSLSWNTTGDDCLPFSRPLENLVQN